MSDYIKREDAIKAYAKAFNLADDCIEYASVILKDIPPADVVEVVRCKDCKHYKRNVPCVGGHYNGCDEWLDEGNPIIVYDNDFCNYGERAEI